MIFHSVTLPAAMLDVEIKTVEGGEGGEQVLQDAN